MRNRVPAAVLVALTASFSAGVAGSVPAVAAGSHAGHGGGRPGKGTTVLRSGAVGNRAAADAADAGAGGAQAGKGAVISAPGPANGGARTVSSASGPAVSPAQAATLPGIVVPLSGTPEGVAVDAAGTVAVSVRNPAAVVLFPINEPLARHTVALEGSARHLSLAGPSGPLLVPESTANAIAEVSLPVGPRGETIPAGQGPQQAVALGSGTVVVADQSGGTLRMIRDGRVARTVRAPGKPGDLAASPDGSHFVVVGSSGRTLTEYTAAGRRVGSARAGADPTHVVAGDSGLYWVADSSGGSVVAFRLGAHGPVRVATVPVGDAGSRPYGLAFDAARDTLWVTLTGTNQLVGLHLSGDQVQRRSTEATVRQPNTVAVAPASGAVVVTGSTPRGQVQFFGVQAS